MASPVSVTRRHGRGGLSVVGMKRICAEPYGTDPGVSRSDGDLYAYHGDARGGKQYVSAPIRTCGVSVNQM